MLRTNIKVRINCFQAKNGGDKRYSNNNMIELIFPK